jgi:hypothetical protein
LRTVLVESAARTVVLLPAGKLDIVTGQRLHTQFVRAGELDLAIERNRESGWPCA